jgi:heterodisulfide reductase subunit A-like polyferredoxin
VLTRMTGPVLIIGAGVAGMTAAVELADSGLESILVDKMRFIGGNALVLYKAFPTDDCFYCFEGNRWRPGIRKCFYRSAMTDQPNIHLKTETTVEEITGKPGSFEVTLNTAPQYIDPKKCTMCGLCLEHSKAFKILSPQCQPQTVFYDPEMHDDGSKKAEDECPTKAINLSAKESTETINVTDIVIATGFHEMQPVNVDEYGYGTHPNIITQLELAKLIDPLNENQGVLKRPSDGENVKRVLMVQCVGSRDENYYPFCSKICCVFALKHANILRMERNNVAVSVVYMDIRTYDSHEKYYRDARNSGVDFIRGRITRVTPSDDSSLQIEVYDSLLDSYLKYSVDLLVLSSALEPSEGSEKLSEILGLDTASGYVAPKEDRSTGEVIVSDHIYACGAALGPAEVPESVTQARAVASKILQGRE